MLILDTNVLSEIRKSTCHPSVEAWMEAQAMDQLYITSITVLEIQRGISHLAQRGDESQAAVLARWLDAMVLPAFNSRILPVDHRDALMAATGLVHGAALVTRNIKHFEDSGVLLINPWEFLAEKSRVPRT